MLRGREGIEEREEDAAVYQKASILSFFYTPVFIYLFIILEHVQLSTLCVYDERRDKTKE